MPPIRGYPPELRARAVLSVLEPNDRGAVIRIRQPARETVRDRAGPHRDGLGPPVLGCAGAVIVKLLNDEFSVR